MSDLTTQDIAQSLYNKQAAAVYRMFLFLRKHDWFTRTQPTAFYRLKANQFLNLNWNEAKSEMVVMGKMSEIDIVMVDKFLAEIVTRKHSHEQYCERYGTAEVK